MRFSLRWLRRYLQTDLPASRLIDALMAAGHEVESVLDLGLLSGNLVVGKVVGLEAIEGADKIRLVKVDAGEPEPLQIVCGAWNFDVGHTVPVARFGMTFPDGFVLRPRQIRGIEGQGMLCSPKELGLTDDADGIWLLEDEAKPGEPYDAIVELSITPNRPDVLSIVGIARDLCAKIVAMGAGHKASIQLPDLHVPESDEKTESVARVTVEAKEDCPRYTARVVRGITVGPSPRWMQVVLEAAGMRPINNIVDITNYVLLELGHPLHAFDLDLLANQHIVVRQARPEDKLTTLDGEDQALEPGDLLICDENKPVALAGIMGGANSEISDGTTDILIESAYFRPQTIRRTAKRLEMSTEASYRFERGTDPKGVTAALNRCAQLVAEIAGGSVCRGIIDAVAKIPEPETILLRFATVKKILGLDLTGREIADVLTPLGFDIQRSDREEMVVSAPTHRVDVAIEADLIEEIARCVGYDRIPERVLEMPRKLIPREPLDEVRETLIDTATALGFSQAINFSFVSSEDNAAVGINPSGAVRVLNPIHAGMAVMRQSLLPSLLQNVVTNQNQNIEEIALFEVARVYTFEKVAEDRDPKDTTPPAREVEIFAAILAGERRATWQAKATPFDFFDMKGAAESLMATLGIRKTVVETASQVPFLHPGRSARFLVKGKPVALFGELHPAVLNEADIRGRACYLEIPLADVAALALPNPIFSELPRFPAVTRDIALVVDRSVRSLDLERTIKKAGRDLLASITLFDVYEGEHVDPGKKSVAYSLVYRAADRTLTEEEVSACHAGVLEALGQENGAVLRS